MTLLAAFILLQLADVTMTVAILRSGGVELNPLLPSHPVAHVIAKMAIVVFIVTDGRALVLATLLSTIGVAWNARQLYRKRRRRRTEND